MLASNQGSIRHKNILEPAKLHDDSTLSVTGGNYAMTVGGVLSNMGGRLQKAWWVACYTKGVGSTSRVRYVVT